VRRSRDRPDRLHGSGRAGGLARATRAYLAGIGTSGSLLAGAAVMFILASAMVAFRGWPHVAAQPAPAEVVVSPRSATAPISPVARRLAFITAAPGPGGAGAPGAAGHALTGTGRIVGSGRRHATGTPTTIARRGGGATVPGAGAGGSSGSATCGTGSCGSNPAPNPIPGATVPRPVQQTVHQVVGTLGNVVGGVGTTLGSTVQRTTSTVGGAVGTLSPTVGGAVSTTGSGAAKAVNGVTQTLTGVLGILAH
jgi:hypothetical protein